MASFCVASFVASNGVLRMRALCTVFIVTCTNGLGEHGDRDEFGTRNAMVAPKGSQTDTKRATSKDFVVDPA